MDNTTKSEKTGLITQDKTGWIGTQKGTDDIISNETKKLLTLLNN